jgi:hypothetical protein
MNEKGKKPEGLEGFSEETLNEMAMEAIEGGEESIDGMCNLNYKCPQNNVAGCGGYGG